MKTFISVFLYYCFSCSTVFSQPVVEFTTYDMANTPVFTGNNFKAVAVGKGNRIWAGTQYQGMYWYDTARKAWTSTGLFNNLFINHIISDNFGGIWVGQSGTSGSTGGASNVAGGINYFEDTTNQYQFFSTNQFLPSRNVRSLYLDEINPINAGSRRLWATMATYITSSNTAAGGIATGQSFATNSNFQKIWEGLQIQPNTNSASAGTPSCYGICGDEKEVWVGAETNYQFASGSTTQILKYDAVTGKHLGGWDQNGEFDNTRLVYNNQAKVYINNSTAGIFPAGFRTTAMHIDDEGRRWIGLRAGGVVVKMGNQWIKVNMPNIFPPGTMVNFNAMAHDEFGNVYIGTSTGLVVFQNGGDPGLEEDYKLYTTADSLPSNNITGMAYDKSASRMILTSNAGVTFMSLKYKIDVKQIWDYSFPSREGNPVGVAADGVSRIYLKIKKGNDTLPDIKAVKLSLKDFDSERAHLRGKFKKALTINGYSQEANDNRVTEITVTEDDIRAGKPGEYWIWYVSPDDFSTDPTSTESKKRRRYDTLIVEATYMNNKKDTMEYNIAVVRPPTIFVHGLAADPSSFSSLTHPYFDTLVPFVNSPLLTYSNALTMDPGGYFRKNALQLLAGDISFRNSGNDQFNTLQGNIEAIRQMKYASNQVDYICHSMGGIMIREAIGAFPKKFRAGTNDPYFYKNYEQGFTHKIITVNTPHNSSPVADAVYELLPKAPYPVRFLIDPLYAYGKSAIGFDVQSFFLPIGTASDPGVYKASEAVSDLQVSDAQGGVNLPETKAKYHMITGDLNWQFFNVAADVDLIVFTKLYKILLQLTYANTYDPENYDQQYAAETRAELKKIMAKEEKVMLFEYFNLYSAGKGFPNFWSEGDGVVPLMSETAQQLGPLPHISPFNNSQGSSWDAHHIKILTRNDVGQRIFELLNTSVFNDAFADVIPANTDPEPMPIKFRPAPGTQNNKPLLEPVFNAFFDTTKVKIDAPIKGSTVFGDSTISIKFRIKDTARLAYVNIHFQSSDSIKVIKSFAQQTINVKVDPSFLNSSKIFVMAVYDRATGDGLNYYTDSLSVFVENKATLQGFRTVEEEVDIKAGKPQTIKYEAMYNNIWIPLASTDPNINVTIDSTSILTYDSPSAYFNGVKKGVALVDFSYKGFTDNVVFRVSVSYDNGCLNRTVAAGSFKNKAIWSKGEVPDVCDSIVIEHAVVLDTSIQVRAARINSGASLILNNAAVTVDIGDGGSPSTLDNYGTLTIQNGKLNIKGKLRCNASSILNMNGGMLNIEGKETSSILLNHRLLFEAVTEMALFNFSGGNIKINGYEYNNKSPMFKLPYPLLAKLNKP